jgi:phage terminase Nu1 subunit (DNA packaging protein)
VHPLKPICVMATVALIALLALSGCGSSTEPTFASAVAHSPAMAWLFEGMKHEDDELDAREKVEEAPHSREEVEEAREQAEQAQLEAAPEPQGEGG